jgi:hypothetical protein
MPFVWHAEREPKAEAPTPQGLRRGNWLLPYAETLVPGVEKLTAGSIPDLEFFDPTRQG